MEQNPELLQYAGFWRRLGAYMVDALCLMPIVVVVVIYSGQVRLFRPYFCLPFIAFSVFFHVYLVAKFGGTPGKLLLKLRIRKLDGSAATMREAMLRFSV